MADPIGAFAITDHAAFEMNRRGITKDRLLGILSAPEQRYPVRPGRDVLQSRVDIDGKLYLVRVFVDIDRNPVEIVTAYVTSNIAKYWRSKA